MEDNHTTVLALGICLFMFVDICMRVDVFLILCLRLQS